MQLSRFVLAYRDVRPGEHVLYSVLEDRYIGVDDATLSAVARWEGEKPARDHGERETQAVLLEEGFLVKNRGGDDERLRTHLSEASEGIPGTMLVTLMPTLACDLACTYCFQKEHPAFTKMSPATEDATLGWILRQVDERGLRHLKVHYFGGEPLTRKDYCLRTANVLSVSMAARGGTFAWTVTTNGIGLDLPFAQAMLRCGDGSFKITLDGDKETHDKMRVYRDGRGSFDKIFANLVAVAPHARIRVGGNFFPDQAPSFEKLLDRIESSGIGAFLEGVSFKPIVDTQASGKATCSGCSSSEETSSLVQLNRSIVRRKLAAAPLGRDALDGTLDSMLGPCELHWKHSYTIDPEGNVYKCPAVAGLPGLEVAKVVDGGPEKVAPLIAQRPWEQCGDCPFMPVCMGGCLGGKYLKLRKTGEVSCKKDLFEQTFRETVIGRYLAEFPVEQSNEAAA